MGSSKTPKSTPPPESIVTRMPNEADFEAGIKEKRKANQRKQGRGTNENPFVYENVMGVGKMLGDTAPTTRQGTTVFNMDNY